MSEVRAVELDGELTIQTAAEECPRLLAVVEKDAMVRVGLAGVTEIDTAGVQLLLAVRRSAERVGGVAEFRDASDAVREALAIVHLDDQLRPVGEVC
ncbi:STAS domain-containing protein [Actinoplanes subtropicus]|uniref:STAS domain-containing protein n=1 Tax=Actinoplanes subtropicus TaxID=543632 RepID=UPI0004C4173D|nr:STAS domain-containing protein [Actinoplanes subtropicus]